MYMYTYTCILFSASSLQIINKGKGKQDETDDEKHKKMMSFMDKYEKEIKKYGMMKDYNAR